MRAIARAGHAANGLVHLVLAGIAVAVDVGAGGASADQSGAMRAIAATPPGVAALWLVVIALLGLTVVAVVDGIAGRRRDGWTALVTGLGKAVAYAVVAGTGLSVLLGGGADTDHEVESWSAELLARPYGGVLVAIAGAVVVSVGVGFVVLGVRRSFSQHLAPPPGARPAAMALGVVGYVAKGVAIGIVGVLLVLAAWTLDPEQSAGLDESLTSLRELPFGQIALLVVAVGIAAYGVFCLARALWPPRAGADG